MIPSRQVSGSKSRSFCHLDFLATGDGDEYQCFINTSCCLCALVKPLCNSMHVESVILNTDMNKIFKFAIDNDLYLLSSETSS